FIIAAVVMPPDVITQFGLAVPLVLLYEVSILSARLVEPKTPAEPENSQPE
ncbi:MAG: twin-arginine translocase subunit TatC, partial [Acetobacter orientalis]